MPPPTQTPLPNAQSYRTDAGNTVTYDPTTRSFSNQEYRPPSPGGATASTPVVTSNKAQTDYQSKLDYLKNLTAGMKASGDARANQSVALAAAKAQADLVASEMAMKQQGLDIQKQSADSADAIARSREKALGLLNTGQGTPTPPTPPPTPAPAVRQGNTGTPVTPPNGATPVTPPATPADTTSAGIQNATSTYQSGVGDVNAARDALVSDMTSKLNSVLNGTIPLSGPQQALITTLQSQLQTAVQTQTTANAANVGAVSEAAFRSGGEYTPAEMAGRINAAVSEGTAKILELDNASASTIAKLEIDFQKSDLDIINKNFDVLTKQLDDKATAIKDMYDSTVKVLQDQRTYDLEQQKFQEQQMKDVADIKHMQNADYIAASGTWTLHDNPDGTQSLVNSRSGQVKQLGSANILTGTGTPGNSGIPIVDNNTKTTSSGVPYVDGTSLTGKEAVAAQNAAAKLGIPYIDKTNSEVLNNVETSRANIQNVENDLQGLNPSSGLMRPIVGAANFLQGKTQFGPRAEQLASFAADQSALIQTIKGMMSLKIVNRGELNTIINGGGMPTASDIEGVKMAKLAKIRNALDTAEKGVMGIKVYDKYNSDSAIKDLQTFSSASSEHASQIDGIRKAFPNLTPYQVLQLALP